MRKELRYRVLESKAIDDTATIALYAGCITLSEVGIGSYLHALHVPCTGYFLSLNQIFLLTRATSALHSRKANFLPASISLVASLLKSLAPIGKKLTPMLAITMQGLLYNLGILLLGNTHLGRALGAVFSACWGFIQPALLYYLIFGDALFHSLAAVYASLTKLSWISSEVLYVAIWAYLGIKIMLALIITLVTPYLSELRFEKYIKALSEKSHAKAILAPESITNTPLKKSAWLACKDLLRPFFIISTFVTCAFFYFAESAPNWLIWGFLRPVAIGFVCFFIMRTLPLEKINHWLAGSTASTYTKTLYAAFSTVLNKLRKTN